MVVRELGIITVLPPRDIKEQNPKKHQRFKGNMEKEVSGKEISEGEIGENSF